MFIRIFEIVNFELVNVRSQIRNKKLPYSATGQQKKENLESWNFVSITDQSFS